MFLLQQVQERKKFDFVETVRHQSDEMNVRGRCCRLVVGVDVKFSFILSRWTRNLQRIRLFYSVFTSSSFESKNEKKRETENFQFETIKRFSVEKISIVFNAKAKI